MPRGSCSSHTCLFMSVHLKDNRSHVQPTEKFHSFNEYSWSAHYWLMPVCGSSWERTGDRHPTGSGPVAFGISTNPFACSLEYFSMFDVALLLPGAHSTPEKALIIFISFLGPKWGTKLSSAWPMKLLKTLKCKSPSVAPLPPSRRYLLWRSVPEFWERLLSTQQHLVKS